MPCDNLEGWSGAGDGGERFKRKGHMVLWPIHIVVWQKPVWYCNYPPIRNKLKKKVFGFS